MLHVSLIRSGDRITYITQEEIKRPKLAADIITNTLIRKHIIQSLVESEERLCLATESAETDIWESDCERVLAVSRRAGIDVEMKADKLKEDELKRETAHKLAMAG